MKRTIATRILLVFPLLLAMLGCVLTDAISGILGGEDSAPEPTEGPIYIIVEGDPTATTAPAEPVPTEPPLPTDAPGVPGGLVLLPCVDRLADCPDSEHFINYIEIGPPNEESFELPANTQLYVTVSWNAVDDATLEENLTNLKFILEVDGQDTFDEGFAFLETKPYIVDETQIDSLKTMSATIEGWTPQQPHTIRFGYEVLGSIHNGRYSYDAGDEFTYILHICPDGGCPPAP